MTCLKCEEHKGIEDFGFNVSYRRLKSSRKLKSTGEEGVIGKLVQFKQRRKICRKCHSKQVMKNDRRRNNSGIPSGFRGAEKN